MLIVYLGCPHSAVRSVGEHMDSGSDILRSHRGHGVVSLVAVQWLGSRSAVRAGLRRRNAARHRPPWPAVVDAGPAGQPLVTRAEVICTRPTVNDRDPTWRRDFAVPELLRVPVGTLRPYTRGRDGSDGKRRAGDRPRAGANQPVSERGPTFRGPDVRTVPRHPGAARKGVVTNRLHGRSRRPGDTRRSSF